MAKKESTSALDEIFGVPTDGSNMSENDSVVEESHDSTYAGISTEDNESFDEKAEKIKESIKDYDAIDVEYGDKPESSLEEDNNNNGESLNEQQEKHTPKGAISEENNESKGTTQMADEHSPSIDDTSKDDEFSDSQQDVMEVRSNDSDLSVHKEEVINSLRDQGWSVTPPAPMWKEFYNKKIDILERYVLNQTIPFESLYKEIKKIRIDIRVGIDDLQLIADKMQEIQQYRERATQIRLYVNSHYFLFKRLVPLLEGAVAMVKCEKPATKQQGVVYEHMSDIIEYFSKLENIHETTKDIIANLDAAYDSLSRQVTMSLPAKNIERYESNEGVSMVQDPKLGEYGSSRKKASQDRVNYSSENSKKSKDYGKNSSGIEEIEW